MTTPDVTEPDACETPSTTEVKQRIGRYNVLEEIGSGGMGVVYSAHDPDLDRKLAIKVLHRGLVAGSTPGEREQRLRREAQTMARLSHPNVVTVHDVGVFEGQVFLAMEYVDGLTLELWMRKRPWREVLDAFMQAGRGLAAAHAAGLIHRDFKPANAVVAADGRVQVMDFGLARSAKDPDDDELSVEGAVAGTPAYMAPEQHSGLDVDARADQFSFCVALYQGLYGERPFEAKSISMVFAEIEQGHVRPPPPNSDVPVRVRRVILRGLSSNPADRWPSMSALLDALDGNRGFARPIAIASTGLFALGAVAAMLWWGGGGDACEVEVGPVWDPARRDRVATAIAATGMAYAQDTGERVTSRLDAYAQAWIDGRRAACEEPDDLLDERMTCLDRNLMAMDAVSEALEQVDGALLPNAVQMVDALPRVDRCADASVLAASYAPPGAAVATEVHRVRDDLNEAYALSQGGRVKEALEIVEEASKDAREVGYDPLLAAALRQVGTLRQKVGKYEEARQALEEAFQVARSCGDDEIAAMAAAELAFVVGYHIQRAEQGRQWAKHARAELDRLGGEPTIEARLLNNLGTIDFAEGKYEEALAQFEHVAELRARVNGPEHADTAAAHSNVGLVLSKLGRNAEALQRHARARKLWEAALGPQHPMVGISINNAAIVLEAEGRNDEAAAAYREAIAIRSRALGADHPSVALYTNNLANVLRAEGSYEEALEKHGEALAIWETVHGADHPQTAKARGGIAMTLRILQRPEEALSQARETVRILEAAGQAEHPDFADVLETLGLIQHDLGHADEAAATLQRAVELATKTLGEDHERVAQIKRSLTAL